MAFQVPTGNPIKHRYTDFGKDRIEYAKWKFRIRDVFKIKYLYTMVHDWVVEEGWAPRDGAQFPETYYVNRDNPTRGKEVFIRWRLGKKPDGLGKNPMFWAVIDLNWKFVGWKETEIVWRGQKVRADRSEIEMECFGAIVIDKERMFQKGVLGRFKNVFVHRVLKRPLELHKKDLKSSVYRLRDLMMAYLQQPTFLPESESGEFYVKRTME